MFQVLFQNYLITTYYYVVKSLGNSSSIGQRQVMLSSDLPRVSLREHRICIPGIIYLSIGSQPQRLQDAQRATHTHSCWLTHTHTHTGTQRFI